MISFCIPGGPVDMAHVGFYYKTKFVEYCYYHYILLLSFYIPGGPVDKAHVGFKEGRRRKNGGAGLKL